MDSGRKSVWLLKTERRGVSGEPDPYKAAFSAANWDCTFVPVLSFNFINQDKLEEAIGGINAYSGLILTSQRAAVALEQALSKRPVSLSANFPVFAVGEATGAAASKALVGTSSEIIVGGNYASKIVEEIVKRHSSSAFDRPLLFLSGSIRRDELPTALLQAEVPFSELCIYETVAQPPEGGKKGSGESNNGGFTEISRPSSPDWVVFFSPSGVDSFLQTYPYTEQESCIWRSIKLAAIGETTAADMARRAAWLAPHVVAAAPNAASLLDSISSYCDTSIGRTDPT